MTVKTLDRVSGQFSRVIQVLLVEDSQDDVDATLRMLRKSKFAIDLHHAPDGRDAWEYLESVSDDDLPDLMLLDLNMPRMDGRELLELMRGSESEAIRTLPVVVLTTSSAESDVISAWNLHVMGYVIKPADGKAFRECIQQIGGWVTAVRLPDR